MTLKIDTSSTSWRPAEAGTETCPGYIYGAGDIGPNGRSKQIVIRIGERDGSWIIAVSVLTDQWDRIKKSGGKTIRHTSKSSRLEALQALPSLLKDLATDVERAYANDGTVRMPGSGIKAVLCQAYRVVTR